MRNVETLSPVQDMQPAVGAELVNPSLQPENPLTSHANPGGGLASEVPGETPIIPNMDKEDQPETQEIPHTLHPGTELFPQTVVFSSKDGTREISMRVHASVNKPRVSPDSIAS